MKQWSFEFKPVNLGTCPDIHDISAIFALLCRYLKLELGQCIVDFTCMDHIFICGGGAEGGRYFCKGEGSYNLDQDVNHLFWWGVTLPFPTHITQTEMDVI